MDAKQLLQIAESGDSTHVMLQRLGLSTQEIGEVNRWMGAAFGPHAPYVLKGILQGIEAGRTEVEWCVC